MKIAFKIPPQVSDFTNMHLLAEAGGDEISFIVFSKSPLHIEGFYTYSFNKHLSDSESASAINEIVQHESIFRERFASVNVFYNQKECTLVPAAYFSEGEKHEVCNLLFGEDKMSFCFYENAADNNIKVVYRVPAKVHDTVRTLFPGSNFSHSVACGIGMGKHSGDVLECTVYHNTIKLLLYKQGKLQLLQYAEYAVPADICYHLLNSCRQFEISPEAVQLILSGMVDEHSNLYKDIYRYFLHVSFRGLPDGTLISEKLNEQPHHFFSHLSALAQCV